MITVADLIKELQRLPQDCFIVLQKDDEGNGYRFANGADDDAFFHGEQKWEFDSLYTKEDIVDGGYEEEYDDGGFTQCVVLF